MGTNVRDFQVYPKFWPVQNFIRYVQHFSIVLPFAKFNKLVPIKISSLKVYCCDSVLAMAVCEIYVPLSPACFVIHV